MPGNSNNKFSLTKKECELFIPNFVKNIEEFENKNPGEGEIGLYLEKASGIIVQALYIDSNINTVNERLNIACNAWPKEASIIQKTIDDMRQTIEQQSFATKIIQEFEGIVNYIESEYQNNWARWVAIAIQIKKLENSIKLENHDVTNKINEELNKNTKLLELVKIFYKEYLERIQ